MTDAETITRRAALAAFAPIFGILPLPGAALSAASGELAPSPFGGHVHALAIHPETGGLFLGARPVYRSTDGGKTRTKVDGIPRSEERANITAIAIDPKIPQTMYATGHGIGVVKSVDGGASWTTKAKGLGSASTEALAIDGREPNRLYVWVMGDGPYRSDDAAESWQRVDDGPKLQEIRSLISLNEATGMGGIWLYAGLDVGIVKSPDCFCEWDRLTNEGLPDRRRVYSLATDPQNPSTLYAGPRAGIFKTTDRGKNGRQVSNEVSDAIVAVHPRLSKVIYAAADDGSLVLSEDGGESWRRVN
jgi:photosystem II stability/assembly factor-like uncharacterized protein